VQRQLEAGEPLGQHRQNPPCVVFPLEGQQRIIGEAYQEGTPTQARFDLALEPLVEDFMQVNIRQQRTDGAPYNVAKHCLELSVIIDRIQLKGSYGESFSGAPLRVAPETDRTATGNRGSGGEQATSQRASSTGDHDHV
jgi:hypothetical protein